MRFKCLKLRQVLKQVKPSWYKIQMAEIFLTYMMTKWKCNKRWKPLTPSKILHKLHSVLYNLTTKGLTMSHPNLLAWDHPSLEDNEWRTSGVKKGTVDRLRCPSHDKTYTLTWNHDHKQNHRNITKHFMPRFLKKPLQYFH